MKLDFRARHQLECVPSLVRGIQVVIPFPGLVRTQVELVLRVMWCLPCLPKPLDILGNRKDIAGTVGQVHKVL